MSADEIDAELLALAGDSSDDEVDSGSVADAVVEKSPSQEPKPSVEKKDEGRAKGVAQKVRKRGGRKKAQKNESEEEDDFGDASTASSPRSHIVKKGSPISSADAPASPASMDDDGDAPLYPVEGKFVSEQERADILAKPEIEREQLLAEREEQVQKRQQDLQLKQLLAKARKDGEKARSKRSATAADLENDHSKRSVRPKAEERGRNKALDAYKQAREAKGQDRATKLETGKNRSKDTYSPSSAGSDRDADGESEFEWAEPSLETKKVHDELPPTIKDFEHVRIGRSNFARVCFWPGFEETVKGCFTRVSVGMDKSTGQNMYRMAFIKGLAAGRPYQLEHNGRSFITDQHVVLAQGNNTKSFPFNICSDSRFTELEFDRYMAQLQKDGQRSPSRKLLLKKNDDINKLLDRSWTDVEISERLNRAEKMRLKHDPAHQKRLKREKLLSDRKRAEQEADEDALHRIEAELTALENSMNGHSTHGDKSSPAKLTSPQSRYERLAELNKSNRQKTSVEVRKAQIEDRKKLRKAREDAWLKKREEEKLKMADLFGSDVSRSGTPQPGSSPRRSRAATPSNGIPKPKSKLGASGLRKNGNLDDEVIGSMDVSIDIEI